MLADLFYLLQEEDHIFIIRHFGPHEYEAVAGGLVRDLRCDRCMEMLGNSTIERLWLEVWPGEEGKGVTPAIIAVIGLGNTMKGF